MGSSQLYSLTWGEFGTSLVSAVQLLRCHGDLVDVTLAAGGRSFPAHKIVLCAASPFLLNLLKSTPCQHPVVMLAGVTAPDLEALLEFVYRGEVSVDSNQLPSLLQAAHCLNIQGLAPGTISAEKPEEITSVSSAHEALTRDVINSFLPIRRRKRTKRRNSSGPQSKWARQDGMTADSENRPMDLQETGNVPLSSEQDVLNIPDVPRKSEDLENNTQPEDSALLGCGGGSGGVGAGGGKARGASDQPGICPLCGAMLRQARNLRRHLLTSCKYRMMGPAGLPVATATALQALTPQQFLLDAAAAERLSLAAHQPPPPPPPPLPPPPGVASHSSTASAASPAEHIVCKVSPLPSPMSSCSIMSPGCASLMSPQTPMVPPQ